MRTPGSSGQGQGGRGRGKRARRNGLGTPGTTRDALPATLRTGPEAPAWARAQDPHPPAMARSPPLGRRYSGVLASGAALAIKAAPEHLPRLLVSGPLPAWRRDTRRQGRAREEQGHLWEVLASARGMGSCGWENPAGPSLPLKSRSSADLAFFLLFSLSLALRCALRF